jgi:two-component system, sensor histidine kinase and response regulator
MSDRSDPVVKAATSTRLVVGEERDRSGVINVEAALSRMGRDRSLLEDVARFFLEDAPGLLEHIKTGIRAGDAEGVAHSAHSLKGLASNFDAVYAHSLAAEIELHGRSSRLDAAALLVDDLEREVARVEAALHSEVLGS